MSVPTSRDRLVNPRRSMILGLPHSTIQLVTVPSGFFTSMWIHACGLIHSMSVTLPSSLIGLRWSNSAWNAWCAHAGAEAASSRPVQILTANRTFFANFVLIARCSSLGRLFLELPVQQFFGEL